MDEATLQPTTPDTCLVGSLELSDASVVLHLLPGTHMLQFLHPALVPLRHLRQHVDAVLEHIEQGPGVERLDLVLAEGTQANVWVVLR